MSDTCIVCLGDLSTGIDGIAAQSSTDAKSPTLRADDGTVPVPEPSTTLSAAITNATLDEVPELIAHLQPCGHELHNECLAPWVERANSCPICRASFHVVELMHHVGGEVLRSYAVQDRTQVAEIDPSMFLEIPDEEDEEQPCQACGEDDNEDVLMYCDGCGKLWHTYCVDLQEVPYGAWFCDNCRAHTDPRPRNTTHTSRGSTRRRTRGQQRRQRNRQAGHDEGWNQVWQSVWSRINLDLDFPYDDDETPATFMRRHRQHVETNRREHEAWERRMRVAELAGAGRRFRETESTLLNGDHPIITRRHRRPSPMPPQETPEETAAWDAFAQARAVSVEPSGSRKKKRQSRTSSPDEPKDEPVPTEVKRRRLSNRVTSTAAGRTSLRPPSPHPTSPTPPPPRRPTHIETGAPSFLQSLLQEVEESSGPSHFPTHRPSPRYAASPPAEQLSPRPSSPALSPAPSNHSSPRATSATPPPQVNGIRPTSPSGLSSSIQPVFPSIGYSPQRSVSPELKERRPRSPPNVTRMSLSNTIARPKPRRPRIPDQTSPTPSRPRSSDTSPVRATIPLSTKSDVQKLVSAALRPLYHEQAISKDEYTTINRDVSRMLYDRIGDFEALDVDGKAKWEKVAGEEVNKAVTALRAQG